MRVLVIGNGGREHALAKALNDSPSTTDVYATRPNAGMMSCTKAIDVDPIDCPSVVESAQELNIDLVVVGPEAPLVAGLCDQLRAVGIPAFGPSQRAAALEGSKAFAKDVMAAAGVPTAAYGTFTTAEDACSFVDQHGKAMVVKADGLAAGKGVIVSESVSETHSAIHEILGGFVGDAGQQIVVEEKLVGPEISVIALVDGTTVRAFPSARDHKRVGDGDTGPNTGGMGAFSPIPHLGTEVEAQILESVLQPTVLELHSRGIPFSGFLYAGLMMTVDGPKVLEFNARMGDPECQALLMRFRGDLAQALYATATNRLDEVQLDFDPRPSVCLVLTSGGYPAQYTKGLPIYGVTKANESPGIFVYHAGTKYVDEQLVTSGGRVLGVTALGNDYEDAIHRAYRAADLIHFEGLQRRSDIAASALRGAQRG